MINIVPTRNQVYEAAKDLPPINAFKNGYKQVIPLRHDENKSINITFELQEDTMHALAPTFTPTLAQTFAQNKTWIYKGQVIDEDGSVADVEIII